MLGGGTDVGANRMIMGGSGLTERQQQDKRVSECEAKEAYAWKVKLFISKIS